MQKFRVGDRVMIKPWSEDLEIRYASGPSTALYDYRELVAGDLDYTKIYEITGASTGGSYPINSRPKGTFWLERELELYTTYNICTGAII